MFLYPGDGCAIRMRSIVPYLRKPTHPFRIAHFQRLLFFPGLSGRSACSFLVHFRNLDDFPYFKLTSHYLQSHEWSYPTVFGQLFRQFSAFPHFRSLRCLVSEEFPTPSHKSERPRFRNEAKTRTLWDRELSVVLHLSFCRISRDSPPILFFLRHVGVVGDWRISLLNRHFCTSLMLQYPLFHMWSRQTDLCQSIFWTDVWARFAQEPSCVPIKLGSVIDNLWRVWVRDQWRYTSGNAISDFDYERRTKNHEATRSNRYSVQKEKDEGQAKSLAPSSVQFAVSILGADQTILFPQFPTFRYQMER